MGFERIENCNAAPSKSRVPAAGVCVQSRACAGRKPGSRLTRYIKIVLGKELANKLVLRGDDVRLAVAFGTERDAGKIMLSVDATAGDFTAKRDKKGNYGLTLNAATADGLFNLEFPTFALDELEPVYRQGTPPALVFACSAEMMAGD